mmetsp:Transcript_17505/g.44395  ORF Transcript_17505/g.44395 Transcript_17505/m.44395 type:complete len:219 (+) Transcript_17505:1129-1785(+)
MKAAGRLSTMTIARVVLGHVAGPKIVLGGSESEGMHEHAGDADGGPVLVVGPVVVRGADLRHGINLQGLEHVARPAHAVLDVHVVLLGRSAHLYEPHSGHVHGLQGDVHAAKLVVQPVLLVRGEAPALGLAQEVVPEPLFKGKRERVLHGKVVLAAVLAGVVGVAGPVAVVGHDVPVGGLLDRSDSVGEDVRHSGPVFHAVANAFDCDSKDQTKQTKA